MKKVFISTSSFAKYDDRPLLMLKEAGLATQCNPHGRKLTEDEVMGFLSDADFLIAGTEALTRKVLDSAGRLKVISRCGVGMDSVDLKAAAALGIKVFNTPYGPTQAVAELTIGLILDLLRKVTLMDAGMRRGTWKKQMGNLLWGKRAGIIGYGRIGRKVAEMLQPFSCEIAYADPAPRECPFSSRCMDMKELLGWAEVLSFHVPVRDRLIGESEIASMRDGAWIVNTSRGGVIDEHALYDALKRGKLSGAAMDVFEDEPYHGPLTELDNVILTPHIGSYAREARVEMEMQAVKNLLGGVSGD